MADFTISRAKRPAETFRCEVDFRALIETGDALSSQSVTAREVATGQPAAAFVGGTSISGTKVIARVQGGENLKDYLLTFTANTGAGDVFAADVLIPVRQP